MSRHFRFGGCLILALLVAACDLGPFGEEDAVEDHRFLIDLRNTSLNPVTIGVLGEPSGFAVQALDRTTIQRQVDPGTELSFTARMGDIVFPQVAICRYEPPSEASPRRQVLWDGATLRCLSWE